jgi:hypothetical protein
LLLNAVAKPIDHGLLRKRLKHAEKFSHMSLIKNGKFFLAPGRNKEDFKTLFARVAAAGVGRPVDKDGCPQGPWTPDLLARAISEIEANRDGIELRTVQLWFENNNKGISASNIRWLARVLGCNDPEASSAWQAELSAAQSRLTAKRRERRREGSAQAAEPEDGWRGQQGSGLPEVVQDSPRFGLACATEALFSFGSILNLAAAVFAGAVALQFVSYFLSIHSITYLRHDGVSKQVGLLWAPNWTVLFVVFLPLFFSVVADQIVRWKNVSRVRLLSAIGDGEQTGTWMSRVEASSYTYWVALLICVGFAGVFQWVSIRLLPLLNGGGAYAVDWGTLALVQPEQIGVLQQIAFTAIAYIYMCLCFYLFIAGLILLSSLVDDFVHIRTALADHQGHEHVPEIETSGSAILRGIFRCTIAGLLVAICMKLTSFYLVSPSPNIWEWLITDARSVLALSVMPVEADSFSKPNQYTSMLVVFLVSAVYLYGTIRIGASVSAGHSLVRSHLAVVFLALVYMLIGFIPGFSLLLSAGLIVACYGLFDPDFRFWWERHRSQYYVP